MEDYKARFKDAPWINEHPSILIAGLGGIGSNTAYCLTKTVNADYFFVDFDRVDYLNVGSQFFGASDVGKLKVDAVQDTMKHFLRDQCPQIDSLAATITPNVEIPDEITVYISAFDNMKARKALFELWKKNPYRELFIDGRLRANYYQVFTVIPGREEEYEKTLFEDSEADDGMCTFKQTTYFGMLIGARITHMVVNFLSNRAMKEDIHSLPFMIEEAGDAVWINIKQFESVENEIIS